MIAQAHRDAAYGEEETSAYIILLKVEADELDTPLHFTDAAGTWDDTLEADVLVVAGVTYWSAPFSLKPPSVSDQVEPGKLVIPNVDERIGQGLRALSSSARITLSIALESDPATAIDGPYSGLAWRNVRADALTAEGDLMVDDTTAEPWPRESVSAHLFPGAFA